MAALAKRKVYHTIVVGGGLVGSALACALGTQQAGSVAILDSAFNPIKVWDGCSDGHIRLDTKDFDGVNYLTQMVENDVLQYAMNTRLEECNDSVDVLRGCKVKGFEYRRRGFGETTSDSTASSCVAVMLEDGREILGSLVVGADGPKSAIKASGGFTETGWKYDQSAVVGTIDVLPTDEDWAEVGNGHGEYILLTNTMLALEPWASHMLTREMLTCGQVALLPLSDTVSSLVWSTTAAEARRLVALPPDDFTNELNHALNCPPEEFLADRDLEHRDNPLALGVSRALKQFTLSLDDNAATGMYKPPMALSVRENSRASFPLALANADMYVRPRVALAGDAAHKVHPLAGQGLNLGLGDARELASTIAKSHELGLDVGDIHALMAYERTRQRAVLPVMAATDFFKRVFSTSNPIVVAARTLGVAGTNAFGPLKKEIIRNAMNN